MSWSERRELRRRWPVWAKALVGVAICLAVVGSVIFFSGAGSWGAAVTAAGGLIGTVATWRGDIAVDPDRYRMSGTAHRDRPRLDAAPRRARIAVVLGFVIGGIGLLLFAVFGSTFGGLLLGTGGSAMAAGLADSMR